MTEREGIKDRPQGLWPEQVRWGPWQEESIWGGNSRALLGAYKLEVLGDTYARVLTMNDVKTGTAAKMGFLSRKLSKKCSRMVAGEPSLYERQSKCPVSLFSMKTLCLCVAVRFG